MRTADANIVILGGGFAGTAAARRLERKLPAACRIVLVSQENYITYHPLLAEVVGASILPGHVVAPIRQMLKRTQLRMAEVTDIDLDRRTIRYLGEGPGLLHYDHLVLACGMIANLDIVPGMSRYALPLKTVGDALFLRNRIIACLEYADSLEDPDHCHWLSTFIIVGGGFSGVELAGEVSDFLKSSLHYYPRVDPRKCRVILLHGGEQVLPELPPALGNFALRKMRKRNIDARLNARVTRVDHEGVMTKSGEWIKGGTVICTIGTAPHPLVDALPLPKQRGRLETAPDMSIPGFPGLWALGDCAAVINARDDRASPPTAQFATRQARQLADNLVCKLRGKHTRPFAYKPVGQLASIGHNKAVAQIFGLRLHGFVAWLLWRGVYLLKVPTLARKVRVYVEWNWQMFFPPDIAHLRFSQTVRTAKNNDEKKQ